MYTLQVVVVLVTQSWPTLCNPLDCSLPDSSCLGILQARLLKWVAIPFSRRSSQISVQTWVSCITGRFFSVWTTGKPGGAECNQDYHFIWGPQGCYLCVLSCSVMSNSLWPLWTVACQAPLSMGILQPRTLEWVAITFSRVSSQHRDRIPVSCIAGGFFTSWATRKVICTSVLFHHFMAIRKFNLCLEPNYFPMEFLTLLQFLFSQKLNVSSLKILPSSTALRDTLTFIFIGLKTLLHSF